MASTTYRAMALAARFPKVALPAARLLHHGVAVSSSTRLVIEGFPRSANSLAVEAICRAGLPREAIAHHTHTPANLLEGISKGLPSLLVVRVPSEAVPEFVATKPSISVGAALRGWISFHEPLMGSLKALLVATHPQVTSDMPGVVVRMNERFSASFPVPDPERIDEARAGVDDYWDSRTGHGLPVLGRGRGSGGAQEAPEETYGSPPLAGLRRRAEDLFERLRLAAG